MEEWMQVIGYEGLYEISNTGIIKGLRRTIALDKDRTRTVNARTIKPRIDSYGYTTVRLSKERTTKTCFVHRLIAEAFIPNPKNLPQVNHISGNKADNSIANLEWTTHRLNAIHAYNKGLNSNYGYEHSKSVTILDHKNELVFSTIRDFCEHYNISYSTGRNALNGQTKLPEYCHVSLSDLEKLAPRGKSLA